MNGIEQLLRRISLCHRVQWGLALAGGLVGLQAGLGAWWAASQGAPMALWGAWAAAWGVAGLALVLLGWLSAQSIRRPVEDTVQCVVRMAGGDLQTRIESPGRDELSWLRHELNSMRKKLGKLVGEVRESAGAVQLASGEIAQGNGDLSQRTEMQAGVLQQTSSSMQMFTDGVRRSAAHVSEAHALAVSSGDVARRGAQLMTELEQGMGAIDASARRIHDIIGSIDGIAFQTNLLALNAAVEAARAGEHGRGFAVVAAEVRALAGRSSAAAREIKQLIAESTERVDQGARLVTDAGSTMREILDSVGRVSHLVGELADVGRSQDHDVGEVLGAVSQIDRATQQNAALVEQMAAAAHSLSDQATRLADTVGRFRIAP